MNDKVSEREFDLLNDKVDGIASSVEALTRSDVTGEVQMLVDSQSSLIQAVNNMADKVNSTNTIMQLQAKDQQITNELLDKYKDSFPFLASLHKHSKKAASLIVGAIVLYGLYEYTSIKPNPEPQKLVKKEKSV
jgi:hypothetical protein